MTNRRSRTGHGLSDPYSKKMRARLMAFPRAVETYPFGPQVAVYKVDGKMFATLSVEDGVCYSNLKCDPIWAMALRKEYDSVQPGYHMNKRHWNTITLDGSLPDPLVKKMVELSYVLVAPPITGGNGPITNVRSTTFG